MKNLNWKGRRRRPAVVILTIVLVVVLAAAFGHNTASEEAREHKNSCYQWMEDACQRDGECMEGLFEACVQSER